MVITGRLLVPFASHKTLKTLVTAPLLHHECRSLSSPATPYPLYYELVRHRPKAHHQSQRRPNAKASANDDDAADDEPPMDRTKRKYYRKREQRMFGGSDADENGAAADFVELKPEVVDFKTIHAREQELYFHDAFAMPWEKDKHYRMVYQLEKKYFPEHSLDKAFVDPAKEPLSKDGKKGRRASKGEGEGGDERGLVFFDEGEKGEVVEKGGESTVEAAVGARDVTERKVEEFFKCLKKVPIAGGVRKDGGKEEVGGEPFLVTRRTELPPRWDGPSGTVVLIDKPKGLMPRLLI